MPNWIFRQNNLVALTARVLDFDEFKSEKHAVATWKLGTISAFV
jgi:hypothetical protein